MGLLHIVSEGLILIVNLLSGVHEWCPLIIVSIHDYWHIANRDLRVLGHRVNRHENGHPNTISVISLWRKMISIVFLYTDTLKTVSSESTTVMLGIGF